MEFGEKEGEGGRKKNARVAPDSLCVPSRVGGVPDGREVPRLAAAGLPTGCGGDGGGRGVLRSVYSLPEQIRMGEGAPPGRDAGSLPSSGSTLLGSPSRSGQMRVATSPLRGGGVRHRTSGIPPPGCASLGSEALAARPARLLGQETQPKAGESALPPLPRRKRVRGAEGGARQTRKRGRHHPHPS